MPKFTDDDFDALQRMSEGTYDDDEDYEDFDFDFGENLRPAQSPTPPPVKESKPDKRPNAGVKSANTNWRTSSTVMPVSKPKAQHQASSSESNRQRITSTHVDNEAMSLDDDLEFDYDDLDAAMAEEFSRGLYSTGRSGGAGIGKTSSVRPERAGLKSGDIVGPWDVLVDPQGETLKIEKVKLEADTIVCISDPRRMNDEFRTMF